MGFLLLEKTIVAVVVRFKWHFNWEKIRDVH